MMLIFCRSLWLMGAFVLLCACPNRTRHASPSEQLASEDVEFVVERDGRSPLSLGGRFISRGDDKKPALILLPGGGRVSRTGSRKGDGTREYPNAVAVTQAMAEHFASAGYLSFAYDKRTCTKSDDDLCLAAPSDDLDLLGPQALVADLEAACALVKTRNDFDGRLVLYAHGQSVQVALKSECAKNANVLVLSSMIPRRVDRVIVDALKARESIMRSRAKRSGDEKERTDFLDQAAALKNAAGSSRATFDSILAERFAKDARIKGATLSFWKQWMTLTDETPALLNASLPPRIFVLGAWDLQLSPNDKKRVEAFAEKNTYLYFEKADHHLLRRDAPDAALMQRLTEALDAKIKGSPES